LASPAFAQEKVIGLLSLPEVFSTSACAPFEPRPVMLHANPHDGTVVATIEVDQNWSFAPHGGCEGLEVRVHKGAQQDELPTREYDYEMPAAIALEQRDGWIRIRLQQGSAWLKPSVADRFMPLSDLFEEFTGVTAVSESFAGRLSKTPGGGGPIMPRVSGNQAVRVVEIRGEWIHVEVLSNSACTAGSDGPPQVTADGWLPLHDQKGEPTVWFSSRGC
jgi:hypothetical protein